MSHITLHRKRLTGRINRLIGQLEGVRRTVETAAEGDDVVCYKAMQQLAAARGAMNGLMTQLIEEHLDHHVVDGKNPAKRRQGADELIKVLRSFRK
jgi:DNA-binding FrmR family transcriptional regulator